MGEQNEIAALHKEIASLHDRLNREVLVRAEQDALLKAEVHKVLDLAWNAIERLKVLEAERLQQEAAANQGSEPARSGQALADRSTWG